MANGVFSGPVFDSAAVKRYSHLSPRKLHAHLPLNVGGYAAGALRELVSPYLEPQGKSCVAQRIFDYDFKMAAHEVTDPQSILVHMLRSRGRQHQRDLPEDILKIFCKQIFDTIVFDKTMFGKTRPAAHYRIALVGRISTPGSLMASRPHADYGRGGYERVYLMIPFPPMTQIARNSVSRILGIPALRRRQRRGSLVERETVRGERKRMFDAVLPGWSGFHKATNGSIVLMDGDTEHRSGPLPPDMAWTRSCMVHVTAFPE